MRPKSCNWQSRRTKKMKKFTFTQKVNDQISFSEVQESGEIKNLYSRSMQQLYEQLPYLKENHFFLGVYVATLFLPFSLASYNAWSAMLMSLFLLKSSSVAGLLQA